MNFPQSIRHCSVVLASGLLCGARVFGRTITNEASLMRRRRRRSRIRRNWFRRAARFSGRIVLSVTDATRAAEKVDPILRARSW